MKNLFFDRSWSLFLDRDGVINRKIDNDYVKDPETFEFLPGVLEALKYLSSVFNRIVVVTNQQGIAKGLYTDADLNMIHAHMLESVKKNGGRIDKIYYCPALAGDNNQCRKPNTGMAFQAQKDFPEIVFSRSLMIGDSISDLEFGKKLDMRTVFISSARPIDKPNLADFIYPDLISFSKTL